MGKHALGVIYRKGSGVYMTNDTFAGPVSFANNQTLSCGILKSLARTHGRAAKLVVFGLFAEDFF